MADRKSYIEQEAEYYNFFEKNVNPVVKQLEHAIMLKRPLDLEQFCIDWLKKYQRGEVNIKQEKVTMADRISSNRAGGDKGAMGGTSDKKDANGSQSGSDSEEDDEFDAEDIEKLKKKREEMNHRTGVSAEAYGRFNKKGNFKPVLVKKDANQRDRITEKINQNLLFKNLSQEEQEIIVNAMEELKVRKGDYVIKQGDAGDCFFIVDEGELDCFKTFKEGSNPKYLKTYFIGEGFGELSLLYNAPRAASIKAKTDSIVFKLDRATFNHVILDNTIQKRKRYEELLKSIDILASLDPYEHQVLVDAFHEVKVDAGEYIIKQGEDGDDFYFLEKGEAIALKTLEGEDKETEVYKYGRGGYFGEIALLHSVKRQASVKALTDCVLMSIDKNSFERILGPLDEILKRNMKQYKKFVNPDGGEPGSSSGSSERDEEEDQENTVEDGEEESSSGEEEESESR